MKNRVWKIMGVILVIAIFAGGWYWDVRAANKFASESPVQEVSATGSASNESLEEVEVSTAEASQKDIAQEEASVEASAEASIEASVEEADEKGNENGLREMLFSDYKSDNEKLLDMFINNEVTAVNPLNPEGKPFYISDICQDPNDYFYYHYILGRADLDNDGENELLMGGPYGGYYFDARDGQVFVMAEGEGSASALDYCYYEGRAYILHTDTSHQGRLIYCFNSYDENGNITESFKLEAFSETDTYDDENATFYFKDEEITACKFEEIKNEIRKRDYEGEYTDTEVGDPNLCIARNGRDYIVQIGIFRLTSITDGLGTLTDEGIEFTATDAAGNPISGIITFEGHDATVTFTDSTWSGIENGDSYTYEYYSYKPQFEKLSKMFRDSYSVVINDVGDNKVRVIKSVREATGLGLKEAKELVEAAPSEVTQISSLIEAQELRDELETLGANVTIK